jgi:hypothetical protein
MRIEAMNEFEKAHRHAQWVRRWHRLAGQPENLLSFNQVRARLARHARRDRGIQEIPVDAIVGSVGRARDYDPSFRPLRKGLRDRWVSILRLQQTTGWEPIIVHKVGKSYFVEDGHHRVSVARAQGVPTIEAHVYEHPVDENVRPAASGRDSKVLAHGVRESALRPVTSSQSKL